MSDEVAPTPVPTSDPIRVRIDETVCRGEAVDLSGRNLDGRTGVEAIRSTDPVSDGDRQVAVACPSPGPAHEHVGYVRPDASVSIRTALAAAARSRGLAAPQDDELATVREELADLEPPAVEVEEAREQVAAVEEADLQRLREEVAAHRGAISERSELDADSEPASERLTEAAGRLSEVETEKLAAEEALRRARERAREARDVREQRFRLQDRAANLERAAREHLAGRLREEFAAAVEAVPGAGRVPGRPSSFEGDDVTAVLAVARVAELRAPVVVDGELFERARDAADVFGAPVIRV